MKKKLALLMASLFLIVGTAWAETIITNLSQLSNDKVYSIVAKEGARGALYATSTSTHLDACGGTLNNAANPMVAINPNSEDQQFALYKYNEQFYMYSVGAGKFLSTMNDRYFPLLNAPSQPVKITKSDTEGYFIIQIADNNINVSTGWSHGCVGEWNTADDGNRLQITEVSDMPENTENQIISVLSSPFRPIDGKMYALKEVSTGLYLDIQTLGIHEPGHTTNSLSLNVHPSIIYFEAGTSDGTWKMKNINGTYASNVSSGRTWNTTISETSYDWIFAPSVNGLTIAQSANNYIGWDKGKSITAGSALYNNAEGGNDKAARIYFTLVEYTSAELNPQGYYTLKLKDANNALYLNFTESGDTKATLQETPTNFYLLPSANKNFLLFQNKDNANQFLGHPAGGWSTTYDCTLWEISEADEDGLVLISRHADTGNGGGKNFGTNQGLEKGRKLYTNVGDNCQKWLIEGVFNCPTSGTVKNGNYEFTSAPIYYLNACNKLRFTLTESGGKFSNGTNRMSLDDFKLYNAKGEVVELQVSYITGNNNKTYAGMLDGVNDTYAGTATWNDGKEDDWFEITLPNEIDLGGAFSFSFVTENTTMNAKAFRIDLSYEKIELDYTITLNVPSGKEATVSYDGTPVDGTTLTVSGYINPELIVATEIPGYTWSAEVDNTNYTVVINYTEAPATENPKAVVALVNRIGGEGTADKFKFVHDPSINSKQETFVLGAEDGKILIKGTTISAITTGLGWYLNNVAKINIAWNSLNEKTVSGAAYADLSDLPIPTGEETHTSDAKYRYYLNYCTFGYSMTSWTWKRWQQEIDWMALHGINMPLQIVGLEEVWRKFLTMKDGSGNSKYNYTDAEAKAFVAGPAYTAWWGMNNLEGWGGTGENGWGGVQDDAWYARQAALAKDICERQRELGMQPVLPGFSGMVPTNFTDKTKISTDDNGGDWGGFHRPHIIDPTYSGFADIAKDYYDCLEAVMGVSQYYSMDPFHEGGSLSSGKYTEAYKAIYDAMDAAKSGSQWVIQQWQWYWYQKVSVSAVPEGKLIVLDLFSDGKPAFDSYNGYAPQDAVFCAIPNFGGRSGLMGRLQNVTDNYFSYKAKYASIKGIGTAPEAIEQTPVTYDLIYQLPWMNGVKPNVAEWVDNYSIARYGKDNTVVKEAWSLLRQGPLNYGADGIQGPVEDVWAARPNLDANPASSWGTTLNGAGGTYTKEKRQKLVDAVYKLIDQEDELALTDGSVYKSNYLYDIVEFGGAVMADYAYDLLKGIKEAKDAGNTALYEARRDAFLQLILDMDEFRGTNLNFRLGKWTQEARDAAKEAKTYGATIANEDWYEFNNARTILTTWGDQSQNSGLKDYSYRSWQGLLADYYYPRWKYYFENDCTNPSAGYFFFEWNWAHGLTHEVGQTTKSTTRLEEGAKGYSYSREPEGNTVELAKSMLAKYIIPVKNNDGTTYYAYRTFTTDLADKATVNTTSGSSVDFTKFFNVPADAVVTGTFINNNEQSANIKAVPTVGAEGTYTGTITIADGTVLQNFTVVLTEPQLNGYYNIYYKGTPLFIGYNEVDDDWIEGDDHKGYKILGADFYTTDAVADKIFSIVPQGDGFTITAQGKTLKSPNFDGWHHVQFSDDENLAGIYKFHKQPDLADAYKIQGVGENDGDVWTHCNYLEVYPGTTNQPGSIVGNNSETIWDSENQVSVEKASIFTLTPVTEYNLTIPESGMTTLCLPFNVVLPEGVVAYDIVNASEEALESGENLLEKIASGGDILLAGTPVILRAENATPLTITLGSNGGKTSKANSCLRGNFVKQVLEVENIKKYILQEGKFVPLTVDTEISANTCWVVTDIEDKNANIEEGHIAIDGWEFTYTEKEGGRITLNECVVEGDSDLEIESKYIVNGETKTVVAISPTFLHGNTTLTSVTIPASLVNLGFQVIEPMFDGAYKGEQGDGAKYDGNQLVGEAVGLNREYQFPKKENGDSWEVKENDAWKLTLDVTIDPTKQTSYNNYGSAIVSTKKESLADNFDDGNMQIYLWADRQHIVVKIDNKDDRYAYSTPALDEMGNETGGLLVMDSFKFELEHDGAGGYQVVITYPNGKAQMYSISASEGKLVKSFKSLYYSLPEGISVKVKFEKLTTYGLFVGCTNLTKIEVDENNPVFKSCDHGVLYDKNGYYVMRIPEGGTNHYEIPSKVVKLYPGAVHGVKADVVLHSNPQIGVVEGHEEDVKNAKFYLSLDDIDATITENETGFGGARDFVSTNKNTYQAARYKRKPLAEGKFGTICLPFVPENATDKYDFFKFKSDKGNSLTFTQVEELEANEAYIYRLKENPAVPTDLVGDEVFGTDESGNDIFETNTEFTIATKAKYDPTQHKAGKCEALGAFVNYYVETEKYANSAFYIYKADYSGFVKVNKKLTYRPYRAFFVVTSDSQAAPSRLNLVLLDGTTTEIDSTLVEDLVEPEYYDLYGRRVMNPVSGGIYIVNGKKVVVK